MHLFVQFRFQELEELDPVSMKCRFDFSPAKVRERRRETSDLSHPQNPQIQYIEVFKVDILHYSFAGYRPHFQGFAVAS